MYLYNAKDYALLVRSSVLHSQLSLALFRCWNKGAKPAQNIKKVPQKYTKICGHHHGHIANFKSCIKNRQKMAVSQLVIKQ